MSWDLIWRLRLRGLVPPVGVGGQSVEQVELLGRLRDLLAGFDGGGFEGGCSEVVD